MGDQGLRFPENCRRLQVHSRSPFAGLDAKEERRDLPRCARCGGCDGVWPVFLGLVTHQRISGRHVDG